MSRCRMESRFCAHSSILVLTMFSVQIVHKMMCIMSVLDKRFTLSYTGIMPHYWPMAKLAQARHTPWKNSRNMTHVVLFHIQCKMFLITLHSIKEENTDVNLHRAFNKIDHDIIIMKRIYSNNNNTLLQLRTCKYTMR